MTREGIAKAVRDYLEAKAEASGSYYHDYYDHPTNPSATAVYDGEINLLDLADAILKEAPHGDDNVPAR